MGESLVCGIDEVGRGSLAGPLIAVGTVFVSQEFFTPSTAPVQGLKDSKKFSSALARRKVFDELLRSPHLLDFSIGCVWPHEINKCGIDEANARAFDQVLLYLPEEPDFLLVDGTVPVPKSRAQGR